MAAPTGVKRVGSIVKTAPKDGCTLMVTAEFGTGKLLKPFLVMDGVTGATLDKRYATWATQAPHTCEVTFQKKHWFDKHITIRWLKWLKKQFPDGSKVLLVWDHAPAHGDTTVNAWLALNIDWLRVMYIPGGLTSIMQVCDLTANAQLKAEFKVLYARWRAGSLRKLQAEYDEKLAEARDAGAAAAVAPPKPALKMDRGPSSPWWSRRSPTSTRRRTASCSRSGASTRRSSALDRTRGARTPTRLDGTTPCTMCFF